jgi:hypothetical protein
MKKTINKICPRCDKQYTGYPALSRRDNNTDICSSCGTEEAFIDFDLPRMPEGLRNDILFMIKLIRKNK